MIGAFEDIWTIESVCVMKNFTVLQLSSRLFQHQPSQHCKLHKAVPVHALKTRRRGGLAVVFLKIVFRWGKESATRPDRFTVGEMAPDTHRIGGWVDHRAGLEAFMKGKSLAPPREPNVTSSDTQDVA